jgi:mannose-6-phosphate isomerase-like protein (cupin superfamily)
MQLKSTPSVVSATRPLAYNTWGDNCEAYKLLDKAGLSVKLEKMPVGTEEVLHFHNQSQQFFYVLKGTAVFEVDEVILMVHEGEGLHIDAGRRHRIMNKEADHTLEFLVCSQPSTAYDRQNLV